MKPEQTELFLVEGLFKKSMEIGKISVEDILDIKKLTGDASSRKYFRVEGESNNFVVCLDRPKKEDLTGQSSGDNFLTIQKILNTNDVRVPQIYDENLERGYLLEEDLGNTTLLSKLALIKNKEEELNYYKEAIDNIIKVHRISEQKFASHHLAKLAFDEEKLMFEINFAQKYFIEELLGITMSENDRDIYQKSFTEICQKIANEKRVLTHRDYHSRNIMLKDNEQIIIDFQDARLGIPQYDLVSLLEDCYYRIDLKNLDQLKKYYWDQYLSEIGLQKDYDTYLHLYNLMAIQRTYKAIGSFAYIYKIRKDKRYLKYIGYAFENLKGFLFEYPEYDQLRITLSHIYYEH